MSVSARGAAGTKLARLAGEGVREVVASSAGNHAQGVAFASTSLGAQSTIVMPRSAPAGKVLLLRKAMVRVCAFMATVMTKPIGRWRSNRKRARCLSTPLMTRMLSGPGRDNRFWKFA